MSFIARELERLGRALREAPEGKRYAELYAAQQALAWVLEPALVEAPYLTILRSVEGGVGCSADSYQAHPAMSCRLTESDEKRTPLS